MAKATERIANVESMVGVGGDRQWIVLGVTRSEEATLDYREALVTFFSTFTITSKYRYDVTADQG